MKYYDLRSDTVTLPTTEMKEAMFSAPLGDDVFGDDPTVNELEKYASELFGMEAALFCPSGTMANQIAIKVQSNPPGEIICHELAHIYQYEVGGISFHSGIMPNLIRNDNRGRISLEEIIPLVNPNDLHKSQTQIVAVENTCNKGAGSIYDFKELKKIARFCHEKNLRFHLDGARLFNALVETKETPEDYGKIFDSISICLSKGLGAASGSLLLGNVSFIKKARHIRKLFGGGMRQIGIIAASGLYALKNNIPKLKEDHQKAQILKKTLKDCSFAKQIMPVDSNIIIFELKDKLQPEAFLSRLKQKGILAVPFGSQTIRFIPNLNQNNEDIKNICKLLRTI